MTEKPNLTPAAAEVLWQLFANGPTWVGDLVSKAGRSELFDRGLAIANNGWSSLTTVGLAFAVEEGLDKRKAQRDVAREATERQSHDQRQLLLRSIAAIVKQAGGTITLQPEQLFGESGACLMNPDAGGAVVFSYFSEEDAPAAIEAARAAAAEHHAREVERAEEVQP